MRRIVLTQNKYALVDDKDYPLVNQYKWYAMRDECRWYACSGPSKKTSGKLLNMHRLIMNAQLSQEVDHREHYENHIDSRKSNLRLCTHAENVRNQRKTKKKTSSQHKGVSWQRWTKKYQAYINVDGKVNHLGYFDDENEAAQAYNEAAIEHFGEFAKLNEIKEG